MRWLSACTFFLLFTACTQVQVVVPNPRIEPPELRGDRGVKIAVSTQGAHVFKATENASTRPPDMDDPVIHTAYDASPGFLYSPHGAVEIGGEVLPLSGGAALLVKWQPLGEGTRRAEEGNVPLAFYLRGGSGYSHGNGDQTNLFGPGGYPWKGTIRAGFLHAGTSLGYRVAEHVLVYGGLAIGQYWIRTEVDQDSTSGDAGGVYKTGYTGFGNTEGMGALFNWHAIQFFLSGEFSHVQYQKAGTSDDLYVHGGVYFTPK